MIVRNFLPSLGNASLAMSLLFSANLCAAGQTVPSSYQVSASAASKPAGPAAFLAAPAFSVKGTPASAVAADFNGDGKADLVVASTAGGEVAVYLGTGQGKFSSPTAYSVGGHPAAIALADLNGDGRQDIVAANGTDKTLSVLLGVGDGTFKPARVYPLGAAADLIAIGDLGGVGRQDVAAASTTGKALQVLLNDGAGSLAAPSMLALSRTPASITLAEFRTGGHADLALANQDGTVSLLLGRGDGGFNSPTLLSVSEGRLSSAVAGDFNHDGKVDLVVASSGEHILTVFLGNGDGTFLRGASYSVGNNPVFAAALDVNGDGTADLLAVNRGSNTVSVLLGNGDGTFKAAADFTVGDGPVALAGGDFYGRGFTGLAVLNASAKTVSVIDGNGNGSFRAAPSYSGDLGPRSVASGDLNGDGRPDLVVTNFCGSDRSCGKGGTVSVYLAKASGGYTLASKYPVGAGPLSVLLADLNGDKDLDAVVLNRTDKSVSVLLGAGDGTFGEARTVALAAAPAAFAVGDFNKDGYSDLAIATDCGAAKCPQPGGLQVLFGAGDGSFLAGRTYAVGYSPSSLAVGDLRQTGSLDILVANRCGADPTCASAGTASVFSGDGKGNFTARADLALGDSPSSVALSALSGTAALDLVVSHEGSDSVAVLRGNGDGTFAAASSYSVGGGPRSVVVGDFSGTGSKGVAAATFKDSTVSVLSGNGDGTLQAVVAYSVGAGPESLVAVSAKAGAPAGLVTANGNSGASEQGASITELANVHPDALVTPTVSITAPAVPPSTPSSISYGTPPALTLTASVIPPGSATAAPTGTVAFSDSGTSLCSNSNTFTPSGTNGISASCTLSTGLSVGTHPITATYTPDSASSGIYASAGPSSPALMQTVTKATPSVSVMASPASSSTYGAPVTFTATVGVTGAVTGTTAPSGNVTFSDSVDGNITCENTNKLLSVGTPSTSSVATCTYSRLSVSNSHTITASYSPVGASSTDTNYLGHTGTLSSAFAVSAATPTVTVSAAPTSSTYGGAVVFTATVGISNPASGTVPPATTGASVAFFADGSTTALTCTSPSLTNSTSPPNLVATCPYSILSGGNHTITAKYTHSSSDPNYQDNSGNLAPSPLMVSAATPTVTVSAAPTSSIYGGAVVFTATVGISNPASGTVPPATTGASVAFFADGSTTALTCTSPSLTNSTSPPNLVATCPYSILSGGNHTITAKYTHSSSDPNYQDNSGNLAPSPLMVSAATPTVTVSAAPTSSIYGGSVVFTAKVGIGNPASGTVPPATTTGASVAFFADGGTTPLTCMSPSLTNSAAPPNLVATCTYSILSGGDHAITATYTPATSDTNYNGSAGNLPSPLTVSKASTTVALPALTSSVYGQPLSITATVNSGVTAANAAPPSGTVTFTDQSHTPLQCAASSSGVLTLPTSTTTPGTNTTTCVVSNLSVNATTGISATYNADLNYFASPASSSSLRITPAPTMLTLSPASATIPLNQAISFTAAVALQSGFTGTIPPTSGNVVFSVTAPSAAATNTPRTVTAGTASLPQYTPGGAGPQSAVATYTDPTGNFAASTSNNSIQTVSQGNTTIKPDAASVAYNGQASLSATVTSSPSGKIQATGGTITFTAVNAANVSSPLCTTPSLSGTTATCMVSIGSLPAAKYQLVATYSGDKNGNFPTNLGSGVLTVIQTTPTVTLFSGNNLAKPVVNNPTSPQPVVNQSLTFTAGVSNIPTGGALTGNFTFSTTLSGKTTVLCSSVSVATPTCTTSLAAGPNSITATYSGDSNFASGSVSPAISISVAKGTGELNLAPSSGPSVINQPVSFTATFQQTDSVTLKGSLVPTAGTVSFFSGGTAIAECPTVALGDACTTGSLAVGTDKITAVYNPPPGNGDLNFNMSQGGAAATQTVAKGTPTIEFTVPGPSTVNDSVTFKASVAPSTAGTTGAGTTVPTGAVAFSGTFTDNGQSKPVTLCPAAPLDAASGQAKCMLSSLLAGTYALTAQYLPGADTNFNSIVSGQQSQSVKKATTSLTISAVPASASTSIATVPVTFTATLAPGAVSVPATGTLTFTTSGGSTASCVPPTSASTANAVSPLSCTIVFPRGVASPFSVTAAYSGDNNYVASNTSPAAMQTVEDFSLVAPTTHLFITQGYSIGAGGSDPVFGPTTQTVEATYKGIPTGFPDMVGYGCQVSRTSSSTQTAPPTCTPPAAGIIGAGGALPFSFAATSAASPGDYSVVLTGTDTSVFALSRSTMPFTVTVVEQMAASPIVFTASQTVNVPFTVPSPDDKFNFACPKNVYDLSSSTPTTGIAVTSTPSAAGFYCAPSSLSGTLGSKTAPFLLGNPESVGGAQAQVRPPHSGFGIAIAAAFGVPLFAIAGWLRRRKGAGERMVRLLGAALLLAGLSQAIGCGSNGFTGTAPTTVPSVLEAGTYLVQLSATDTATGQVYYSVVDLQLTAQ